jgi:hypothetical protein
MLIDIDPIFGTKETMLYDPSSKTMLTTVTQNVDALLDRNTAIYNSQDWRGEDNDFWFVASVPLVTLEAWRREFNSVRPADCRLQSILNNNDEWESFIWLRLNSSDFRKLRTAPVRV